MSNKKNKPFNGKEVFLLADELGDAHLSTSAQTPLRKDAFELSEEEKMMRIATHFKSIMETLGLDLTDDSLSGTPQRVAKMFVKEIFSGLDPLNKPKATLFENRYGYQQMLVEKDINVMTTCEHHFLPIYGKAHVAYISSGKVIGLSKINRIVEYFCKRPQVQERLTIQIALELASTLQTNDVAIYIDAKHMCVHARGVEDRTSSTITMEFMGRFENDAQLRNEFLASIRA